MNTAPRPQVVEINDPMECDIYLASPPLAPGEGQGRVCGQCGHSTWARTPTCMWCGFERFAHTHKVGIALLTALGLAIVARIYAL